MHTTTSQKTPEGERVKAGKRVFVVNFQLFYSFKNLT
jgi:hypothetical protein